MNRNPCVYRVREQRFDFLHMKIYCWQSHKLNNNRLSTTDFVDSVKYKVLIKLLTAVLYQSPPVAVVVIFVVASQCSEAAQADGIGEKDLRSGIHPYLRTEYTPNNQRGIIHLQWIHQEKKPKQNNRFLSQCFVFLAMYCFINLVCTQ